MKRQSAGIERKTESKKKKKRNAATEARAADDQLNSVILDQEEGTDIRKPRIPYLETAPHTLVEPIPAAPYAMEVMNYVVSSSIRPADRRRKDPFPVPLMVDSLKGRYSEEGFKCVTVKQGVPKVCCSSHAKRRGGGDMDSTELEAVKGVKPLLCCHVYPSGKVIGCGAKTQQDAVLGMTMIQYRWWLDYRWLTVLAKPRVTNVVSSMALGYTLDLVKIYEAKSDRAMYAPQLYPGLQYYPGGASKRKPCVIVHATGAIVVVGALDVEDATKQAATIDWPSFARSKRI